MVTILMNLTKHVKNIAEKGSEIVKNLNVMMETLKMVMGALQIVKSNLTIYVQEVPRLRLILVNLQSHYLIKLIY